MHSVAHSPLQVDARGRLLSCAEASQQVVQIIGAHCAGPNQPYRLLGEPLKEETTRATRSRRADFIPWLLVALLVLAGLTHCTPARKTAAKRYRTEHHAPAHGRYDWYMADGAD